MKSLYWIVLFIGTVGCIPSFNNPFEKDNRRKNEWFVFCMAGFGSSFTTTYEVVDRNDGTLEVMRHYDTVICFGILGTSRYSSSEYFIKKCTQGQVYRPEQNDCKGTGSASDYYGAQKYQWCPTNDTSCEQDKTKSPAYTTCSEDTTAGKKWELTYLPKKDTAYITYYDYLKTISDEIPSGISNYYWSASYFPKDDATKTDAQLLIESSDDALYSKDTYLYVICINK
ncbi:MAG: hypothetical protein KDK90_24810 [Leptospiraceae bacterium]|nr:hypothetical protein [Leptospiraceae bacterium]